MTKVRPPLSFAHAITRIAGLIGWDAAAAAVARKERLVRLWSEPDHEACPTLRHALALDAAYAAAGGDGAPLLDAYAVQLNVRVQRETACHGALAHAVATATRECGEAISAAIAMIRPGASPSEIHRASADAKDAIDALMAMMRQVQGFLPDGAGPLAGNTGGAR